MARPEKKGGGRTTPRGTRPAAKRPRVRRLATVTSHPLMGRSSLQAVLDELALR